MSRRCAYSQRNDRCMPMAGLVRLINNKTVDPDFNAKLRHHVLQRNLWERVNDTLVGYRSREETLKDVDIFPCGTLHDERHCHHCKTQTQTQTQTQPHTGQKQHMQPTKSHLRTTTTLSQEVASTC